MSDSGKLYVVATPIGNLSDLSPRAIEILNSCDLIAAEDTRHTLGLLTHFEIKKPLISYHKFNETERSPELLDKIKNNGMSVAVVTDAGTPAVSDPGSILVRQAHEAGIEVIAVPGPCAAASALSASGAVGTAFAFYGFLPRKNSEIATFCEQLKTNPVRISIFYEAPGRLRDSLQRIGELCPEGTISLSKDISKVFERNLRGSAEELLSQLPEEVQGEYAIVLELPEVKQEAAAEELSPEALLVNELIKGTDTKTACKLLAAKYKGFSKNDFYKASLRLKKLFADEED